MLSAAGIDGGHRDFAATIGSGLADAILQHDAEVGAVAEWLAANGVPAQTTDRAADEDDQRPADEWLWVLEACMLVAAGSPGDLSDEQWKRLAAVYAALIPHIHDPFRWRRDDIGNLPAVGRRRAVSEVLQAGPGRATAHFLVQATLLRHDDLGWVLRQHANAPAGSELAGGAGLTGFWSASSNRGDQPGPQNSAAHPCPLRELAGPVAGRPTHEVLRRPRR